MAEQTGSVPQAGGQQGGEGQGEQEPTWAKALRETMASSLGQVGTGINTLVTLAQQTQSRRAEPPPEEPDDDPTDLLDDANLETLPRAMFAKRLLDTFAGEMQKQLKPITEGLNQTQQRQLSSAYAADATAFAEKTADFGEWRDEMMKIAEAHPDLPVARIYHLARAENPKKLGEMLKKYPPKEASEEKPDAGKPAPRKGTLSLPASSNSSTAQSTRMSADDAAKAAWEDSVSKFGSITE